MIFHNVLLKFIFEFYITIYYSRKKKKFPSSGHLIFFFTNIRNENKTQKWPRARDRTSLISLRCVFFLYKLNITRFVPTGFVNHTEECK
jgi:hypothetical protein